MATTLRLLHFQASFFWGGGFPPPKKLTIPPPIAAKLCDLNLFFGWENELQIYVESFLLIDSKQKKYSSLSSQKGASLCIRLAVGSSAPPDPLVAMGAYF